MEYSHSKVTLYLPVLFLGMYIITLFLFDDSQSMFMVANTFFLIMVIESLHSKWNIRSRISIPRIMLLLYSAWTMLSVLWAWDRVATIEDIKRQIIYIILWMAISNILKQNNRYIEMILRWIIAAGICLTIYLLFYYGISEYMQALFQGKRIGGDIVQLNKLGMYAATSCIIAFNFYLEKKRPKYLVFLLVPLIAMIGTGSKRAFLMLVVSLIISVLLRIKNKETKNRVVKSFLALFLVYISFFLITELEILKGVLERFQELFLLFENKDTNFSRFLFIKYGVDSFLDNPIIGLGSGNSHKVTLNAMGWATYLHNNYLEELVNLGIIGFGIYYGIYCALLKQLIPKIKKGQFCSRVMTVLLTSQLISDIAVTSYNLKFTYILFAIAISVVENSTDERNLENENI